MSRLCAYLCLSFSCDSGFSNLADFGRYLTSAGLDLHLIFHRSCILCWSLSPFSISHSSHGHLSSVMMTSTGLTARQATYPELTRSEAVLLASQGTHGKNSHLCLLASPEGTIFESDSKPATYDENPSDSLLERSAAEGSALQVIGNSQADRLQALVLNIGMLLLCLPFAALVAYLVSLKGGWVVSE